MGAQRACRIEHIEVTMSFPAWARASLIAAAMSLAACSDGNRAAMTVADTNAPPASAVAEGKSNQARAIPVAMRELPDFTALVERYGDAVVNVAVVGRGEKGSGEEEALLEFFHRFGIPAPEGGPGLPGGNRFERGAGSGFIVSKDGYILTNAHVVANADDVTVRLTDRREFPAKVVGFDTRTDVAVIKIDARDLPVVSIADDRDLKTGEWVLAIGSPFGLDNTATAGIVSGTSRALGGDSIVPFIQTDVAVNPGNSGGPLFNLDGEVVGMNSMIFSQSGGYMGISFAIPIGVAMDVRDQLIKTGHVVRGRIGVFVQDVDAALANSFKLDRPRGALVSGLEEGGPADKAGLKPGDVTLEVGGTSIEQSNDLSNTIAKAKPGTDTTLTVWRGGKARELEVRIARMKEPEDRNARAEPEPKDAEGTRLGLVVRSLTPEEKESAETEGNVVVSDVQGSAAIAGIQPGDIILAVNDRSVKSVQDLRAVASKLKSGQSAALLVERGGAQVFVPIRAG
jgi:serine protease Do